jgi:hypothetical protein
MKFLGKTATYLIRNLKINLIFSYILIQWQTFSEKLLLRDLSSYSVYNEKTNIEKHTHLEKVHLII